MATDQDLGYQFAVGMPKQNRPAYLKEWQQQFPHMAKVFEEIMLEIIRDEQEGVADG